MTAAGEARPGIGSTDVIVAVSTAPGRAAIGVVRMSGPGSLDILEALTGRTRADARRMVERTARDPDTGSPLDRVLVWYGRAPHSYTGEDLVEIHAHGNPWILESLVTACCSLGARRAAPGEFTRRALEAGRLDLAGAEAVLAAIEATSTGGARIAAKALDGVLSREVRRLRREVLGVAADIEAAIDFEDDVGDPGVESLGERMDGLCGGLREMAGSMRENARLLDGADVALLGPVNAGKSTLFNRLVGRDRSIVHADPGTTRDVITEHREVDGLLIRFHDTAGIREPGDEVESEGIRRARELRHDADLVVFVRDATRPGEGVPEPGDLVVLNKVDLRPQLREEVDEDDLAVCALAGEGVDDLLERIRRRLGRGDGEDAVLWTGRQAASALAAADQLERARHQLAVGEYGPAAVETRGALESVQGILGIDPTRDVLDELLTRFCVGK